MTYLELLGTPFKYGGRTVDGGLDCWGLCLEFWRLRGLEVRDPLEAYDERVATPEANVFDKYRTEEWEPVAEPGDGDLVCMAYNNAGVATHCGIYLHGGRLLHTLERTGVIISPWYRFQRFVTAIYRYVGAQCRN